METVSNQLPREAKSTLDSTSLQKKGASTNKGNKSGRWSKGFKRGVIIALVAATILAISATGIGAASLLGLGAAVSVTTAIGLCTTGTIVATSISATALIASVSGLIVLSCKGKKGAVKKDKKAEVVVKDAKAEVVIKTTKELIVDLNSACFRYLMPNWASGFNKAVEKKIEKLTEKEIKDITSDLSKRSYFLVKDLKKRLEKRSEQELKEILLSHYILHDSVYSSKPSLNDEEVNKILVEEFKKRSVVELVNDPKFMARISPKNNSNSASRSKEELIKRMEKMSKSEVIAELTGVSGIVNFLDKLIRPICNYIINDED